MVIMTRKRYDKQFKISAAKIILAREMSVKQLSEELRIKDTTLRRWANEYERDGETAFSGNGAPTQNKDYEIFKLRKEIDELEMENKLLKYFRAFLNHDHV